MVDVIAKPIPVPKPITETRPVSELPPGGEPKLKPENGSEQNKPFNIISTAGKHFIHFLQIYISSKLFKWYKSILH